MDNIDRLLHQLKNELARSATKWVGDAIASLHGTNSIVVGDHLIRLYGVIERMGDKYNCLVWQSSMLLPKSNDPAHVRPADMTLRLPADATHVADSLDEAKTAIERMFLTVVAKEALRTF
jgi:hypothetical protein